MSNSLMPLRRVPSRIALRNAVPDGLVSSLRPGLVATVWSCTAKVRSGRCTARCCLLQLGKRVVGVQFVQDVPVDIDQIAAVGCAVRPDGSPRSCRTKCAAWSYSLASGLAGDGDILGGPAIYGRRAVPCRTAKECGISGGTWLPTCSRYACAKSGLSIGGSHASRRRYRPSGSERRRFCALEGSFMASCCAFSASSSSMTTPTWPAGVTARPCSGLPPPTARAASASTAKATSAFITTPSSFQAATMLTSLALFSQKQPI